MSLAIPPLYEPDTTPVLAFVDNSKNMVHQAFGVDASDNQLAEPEIRISGYTIVNYAFSYDSSGNPTELELAAALLSLPTDGSGRPLIKVTVQIPDRTMNRVDWENVSEDPGFVAAFQQAIKAEIDDAIKRVPGEIAEKRRTQAASDRVDLVEKHKAALNTRIDTTINAAIEPSVKRAALAVKKTKRALGSVNAVNAVNPLPTMANYVATRANDAANAVATSNTAIRANNAATTLARDATNFVSTNANIVSRDMGKFRENMAKTTQGVR